MGPEDEYDTFKGTKIGAGLGAGAGGLIALMNSLSMSPKKKGGEALLKFLAQRAKDAGGIMASGGIFGGGTGLTADLVRGVSRRD